MLTLGIYQAEASGLGGGTGSLLRSWSQAQSWARRTELVDETATLARMEELIE